MQGGGAPESGEGGGAVHCDPAARLATGKRRGGYNCGRCGLPKKGHTCTSSISSPSLHHPPFLTPPPIASLRPPSSSTTAAAPKHKAPAHSSASRRHLDFTAEVAAGSDGAVPDGCLAEVLRRLPPPALLAAAQERTKETEESVKKRVEELKLKEMETKEERGRKAEETKVAAQEKSDEAKGSIFNKIGGVAGAIREKISGVQEEAERRQEEEEALSATTEGEEAVLAAQMADPYRAKRDDVGVVRGGAEGI